MLKLNRRLSSLVVVASVLLSAFAVLTPSFSKPADAARPAKVKYTVCHRTNAIKNPYRRITVAWSAVDDNNNGHDALSHDGVVFQVSDPVRFHGATPRVYRAALDQSANNHRWGDIFFAQKSTGNQWNANNWFVDDSNKNSLPNTAGRAIFDGTVTFRLNANDTPRQACKTMSAVQYIESEREEDPNRPMSLIMDELDDMEAAEDLPLKRELGVGATFRSWYNACTTNCENIAVITTALNEKTPSVTTEPPTNLVANGTSSSARINGTITPLGNLMSWYFELAEENDFSDSSPTLTEVFPPSGGTSSAEGPVPVFIDRTGLNNTKTYYYRTVGLITSGTVGTDDYVESYMYGVVKQFSFNSPGAPSITGITCGDNSLSVAFTAPTVNAGSITSYEYSTDGGATYSSASGTTSPISISGLTNGRSYDVVIRAKAFDVVGLDSTVVVATPCGTPVAVTDPAAPVTQPSTTMRGNLTGNGNALTVEFVWGTDENLLTDTTTSAATPATLPGTAIEYPVTFDKTNLVAGTTYHYRVVGRYGNGSSVQGVIRSFTVPSVPFPAVTTEPATDVTETSAIIRGSGTTNGADSTVTFTWGTRSDLIGGDTQSSQTATPGSLTDSGTAQAFARNLTGLTPGMTYYFRAHITNVNGSAQGNIRSFTTSSPVNQNQVTPPEVTTEPATSVTGTTATINGTGTSNGATSTVTFTWGTSPTLASNNTTVNATPSSLDQNASGTAVSAALTGLTPGTTYYFRTSITNTNGSADGIIREFTTPAAATVTPAATSNDPLGRVIGTAWFDINRNNRRDAGEPLLPGVDVQLTPTGVTGQSAGTVRKTNFVMKTNIDGAFDFSQLPPGTYLITSVLPAEFGIQESWDSTGDNDWKATVTVVALQTSRGDFAAIGAAQADGTVEGGGGGSLDATWTGFDQKDDTNDDVTFTTKLATDGDFTLTGLPTGKYTVRATSKSGRTLVAPSTLRVTSKGATLTLNGITMNVKIVGFLPQTGVMNMFLPFGFATMLLPAGVAVRVATRRRRLSRL